MSAVPIVQHHEAVVWKQLLDSIYCLLKCNTCACNSMHRERNITLELLSKYFQKIPISITYSLNNQSIFLPQPFKKGFLSCWPHFPSFLARGFLPHGNESLCLYVLKTVSRGEITFPTPGVESLFRPLGLETLFRPWDGNSIKVIPPQGWKSCFTFLF